MESVTNMTNASRLALKGARGQQTVTDDLLAAVNQSRSVADDAISDAERTLTEAEETLKTLRGQ